MICSEFLVQPLEVSEATSYRAWLNENEWNHDVENTGISTLKDASFALVKSTSRMEIVMEIADGGQIKFFKAASVAASLQPIAID